MPKFRETEGVEIRSFHEWKEFIYYIYSEEWRKSSDDKLRSYWGEPKKYPCIVTYYVDILDAFSNKNLHVIYPNYKPTGYKITEGM